MTEKIETQNQREQSASQKNRELSVRRGAGFYFGVYDEMNAAANTKTQQPQCRWYHKISGWVCEVLGFLNEYSTFIIMLATLANFTVACWQWSTMREETAANQMSAKIAAGQLAEMRSGSADTKTIAEAAKQSAQVAEQTLVLSQRPWVSVDVRIAEPLVFDSNGARTSLLFTMKNLGHSPAVSVNMHFAAFPMQNLGDEVAKRKEICTRIQEWDKGEVSEMILPGGQSEEGRALRIKKADIDKNTLHIPGGPSVVTLAVVGCVDYRFTFAKEHHQTEFSFVASARGLSVHFIDPTQGPYPVENIWFASMGGSHAN